MAKCAHRPGATKVRISLFTEYKVRDRERVGQESLTDSVLSVNFSSLFLNLTFLHQCLPFLRDIKSLFGFVGFIVAFGALWPSLCLSW